MCENTLLDSVEHLVGFVLSIPSIVQDNSMEWLPLLTLHNSTHCIDFLNQCMTVTTNMVIHVHVFKGHSDERTPSGHGDTCPIYSPIRRLMTCDKGTPVIWDTFWDIEMSLQAGFTVRQTHIIGQPVNHRTNCHKMDFCRIFLTDRSSSCD